jgi:hypothetical protein
MVQKSVLLTEAERINASEEFLKFLEVGYDMNRSLSYKKVVKSVEKDDDSMENYVNRAGDFMTTLFKGDLEMAYRLADTTNSKILEEAYPKLK